jgi:hypothetical protein
MSQEWKEPAAGEDVQMPLGTGGDGAALEEFATPKARVNTSTLALIAAFAAAVAVLYFMGMQNKPRAASAGEQDRIRANDTRVNDFLRDKDGRKSIQQTNTQLLDKLGEFMNGTKTAAAAPPAKNPFEQELAAKPPEPNPFPQVVTTQSIPPEDPMLKEVAKEFGSLKLQLVMLGSSPSAMINNRVASIGTRMGHLTVTDIQSDRVLLTYESAEGKKTVLALLLEGAGDSKAGFGGLKPK